MTDTPEVAPPQYPDMDTHKISKRKATLITCACAIVAGLWAFVESDLNVEGSWMELSYYRRSIRCIFPWGMIQFTLFFLFFFALCQVAIRSRVFALLVFLPLAMEEIFSQQVIHIYHAAYETVVRSAFNATFEQMGIYADPRVLILLALAVVAVVAYLFLYNRLWRGKPSGAGRWMLLWLGSAALPLVLVKGVDTTRYWLGQCFVYKNDVTMPYWVGSLPEGESWGDNQQLRDIIDREKVAECYLPYARILTWVEITWNEVLFPHELRDCAAEESSFTPQSDKLCVILYIGEAYRYDHTPFSGYHRNTLPQVTEHHGGNIIPLPHVISYDTCTIPCIFGMLTGADETTRQATYNSFMRLFRKHGFHCSIVENLSDMAPCFNSVILAPCLQDCYEDYSSSIRVSSLAEPISKSVSNHNFNLIVIEDGTCHGPGYPAATGKLWGDSTVDMYDEERLVMDSNLFSVIESVKDIPAIVVFISDHAESLGEGGRFGHGGAMSAMEQRRVAAFVWYSDEYAKLYPDVVRNLKDNADIFTTQAYVFHTMPTLGAIHSAVQNREKDMASPQPQGGQPDAGRNGE